MPKASKETASEHETVRASGKLSRDDYREVLEPALRERVDSGELRLLFVSMASSPEQCPRT